MAFTTHSTAGGRRHSSHHRFGPGAGHGRCDRRRRVLHRGQPGGRPHPGSVRDRLRRDPVSRGPGQAGPRDASADGAAMGLPSWRGRGQSRPRACRRRRAARDGDPERPDRQAPAASTVLSRPTPRATSPRSSPGCTTPASRRRAKHFPGLGRVVGNTDFTDDVHGCGHHARRSRTSGRSRPRSTRASRSSWSRSRPTSASTPTDLAVFSPTVIDGMLRHDLAFGGVVISDALGATAVSLHPGRHARRRLHRRQAAT